VLAVSGLSLHPINPGSPMLQSVNRYKEKPHNNPYSHNNMASKTQVAPLRQNQKRQVGSPRPGHLEWPSPQPNNIAAALFGSKWGRLWELEWPWGQHLLSPAQVQADHRAVTKPSAKIEAEGKGGQRATTSGNNVVELLGD